MVVCVCWLGGLPGLLCPAAEGPWCLQVGFGLPLGQPDPATQAVGSIAQAAASCQPETLASPALGLRTATQACQWLG